MTQRYRKNMCKFFVSPLTRVIKRYSENLQEKVLLLDFLKRNRRNFESKKGWIKIYRNNEYGSVLRQISLFFFENPYIWWPFWFEKSKTQSHEEKLYYLSRFHYYISALTDFDKDIKLMNKI